ncbi:Ferritin-like metal-binding protein YciE [Rhizobium sp. RU20A]|nr:Ferritin-like metal-binding protein YciE [Rhizobium sp. RU20A]
MANETADERPTCPDRPHPKNLSSDKEIPVATKTLNDLFYDTLKDIYYAERQILKALPKMARAASDEKLKQAFLQHKEETQGQIERLQQVFEIIGKRAQGKTCEAIQGIIAEGEEIMEEFKDTPAIDAGLISSAQAVEHYEIARYGTLKAWAMQLGHKEVVSLLDATLKEESKTDESLTQLAETAVNAAGEGARKAA